MTYACSHNPHHATPAGYHTQLGLAIIRFRSPLLSESLLFSLPAGTEMFHFPAFPPHTLYIQVQVTGHDSSQVPPFGHPRITARLPTPQGLSQAPTSFIGSRYQGIHHAPFTACHHTHPTHTTNHTPQQGTTHRTHQIRTAQNASRTINPPAPYTLQRNKQQTLQRTLRPPTPTNSADSQMLASTLQLPKPARPIHQSNRQAHHQTHSRIHDHKTQQKPTTTPPPNPQGETHAGESSGPNSVSTPTSTTAHPPRSTPHTHPPDTGEPTPKKTDTEQY